MGIVAEEWRAVEGYEGVYEVSDLGRVRGVDRTVELSDGRSRRQPSVVLGQFPTSDGYLTVSLSDSRRKRTVRVHQLVCSAFNGSRIEGQEINHIDGDKTNNRPSNLQYVTRSQNIQHAFRTGLNTGRRGVLNGRSKLTESDVRNACESFANGLETKAAIARRLGVNKSAIGDIVNGKTWRHLSKFQPRKSR